MASVEGVIEEYIVERKYLSYFFNIQIISGSLGDVFLCS
jgi:hypothetical protein